MSPADKEKLDLQARVQQMQINTRLTALQTALELMKLPNFNVTSGFTPANGLATKVDHVTLLAMSGDIEKYILGNLEQEAKDAIEALGKPKIDLVKQMPNGLRP